MNGFSRHCAGERGLTLVELVIAMVVVSIALAGVLLVMNTTTMHSVDPMVRQQALAIAEAYLEEILLKEFVDPDGADGEATRDLFDDIDDYHGLTDVGARDQNGVAIAGLGGYTVQVSVQPATVNGVTMLRVAVTVTSGGETILLAGYRAN